MFGEAQKASTSTERELNEKEKTPKFNQEFKIKSRCHSFGFDYMKLLSDLVNMKQYYVALHLFDEMLLRDALVDHFTLSIAIACCCRLKRAGFELLLVGKILEAAKSVGRETV